MSKGWCNTPDTDLGARMFLYIYVFNFHDFSWICDGIRLVLNIIYKYIFLNISILYEDYNYYDNNDLDIY